MRGPLSPPAPGVPSAPRPAVCLAMGAGTHLAARLSTLGLDVRVTPPARGLAAVVGEERADLVVLGLGPAAHEALEVAGAVRLVALVVQSDALLRTSVCRPWSRRSVEARAAAALAALDCPVLLVHRRDADVTAARRLLAVIRRSAELVLVDGPPSPLDDPSLGPAVEGFLRDALLAARAAD